MESAVFDIFQAKNGGGCPKNGEWSFASVPETKTIQYAVELSTLRDFNSHIEKCLCVYCEKVMVGPLMFRQCEHGSCRSCFLEKNIRKPMAFTVCERCGVPINSELDLIASGVIQTLIDSLNVKCNRGGLLFSSYEFHFRRSRYIYPGSNIFYV